LSWLVSLRQVFNPAGIARGSVTAAIQLAIGNVAAGSGFATLQSLGASGALVTAGAIGASAACAGAAPEGSPPNKEMDKESKSKDYHDKYFTNNRIDSLMQTKTINSFVMESAAKLN